MDAQKARRIAVEIVTNITDGDPAYVANSTVVVGAAKDGTFWVADNGEEVDGLTRDQAIDTIVENLAD